mmetsp:Transcript_13843/g.34125  ORF Transcript_13843/g.34125 Transcript_13843/m.34125 type:complete len:238 (+) Transcript_13843:1580-2293(+)
MVLRRQLGHHPRYAAAVVPLLPTVADLLFAAVLPHRPHRAVRVQAVVVQVVRLRVRLRNHVEQPLLVALGHAQVVLLVQRRQRNALLHLHPRVRRVRVLVLLLPLAGRLAQQPIRGAGRADELNRIGHDSFRHLEVGNDHVPARRLRELRRVVAVLLPPVTLRVRIPGEGAFIFCEVGPIVLDLVPSSLFEENTTRLCDGAVALPEIVARLLVHGFPGAGRDAIFFAVLPLLHQVLL